MLSKSVFLMRRGLSGILISRSLHTVELKELRLKEYSNCIKQSLELHRSSLSVSLKSAENDLILAKLIAAPINPADLNIIQGKYGILPKSLPAPLGNEGLFEVCEVANENSQLKVGDRVLPNKLQFATWRSHVIDSEANFIKLPDGLDQSACATLSVNPITAYRMLLDFKKLSPGDTVIQNGANSGVGQAVIQLGNIFKLNVVNIVRKRETQAQLTEYLESIGARNIYTEDMLRKVDLVSDIWKSIPRPKLALNCVGGRATTDMVRLLDNNSVLVTYGGMSRQPLMLNTADFIFKDLKACGFWLTRWRQNNPEAYKRSVLELCDFIADGRFKAPKCEAFEMTDFIEAFNRNAIPFLNSKIIFRNSS